MLRRVTLPSPDPAASRRFHAAIGEALGDGARVEVVAGDAPRGVRLVLDAAGLAARERALAAGRSAGGSDVGDGVLRAPEGVLVEIRLAAATAAPAAPTSTAPVADASAAADTLVFATAGGLFARAPLAGPGAVDRVPLAARDEDPPLVPLPTGADATVLVLAADGWAWRLRVADLAAANAARLGERPLPPDNRRPLAALAPTRPAGGFLLLVTARGEVKRMDAAALAQLESAGGSAFDVPAGDRLIAAVPHGEGDHAILETRQGKALRIDLRELRPVKTPSAGGVAGMRLAPGDEIVGATRAAGDVLAVFHRRGNAKAVPLAEYPVKGRGTGGVQSADPETPRRAPSGPIHAACAAAASGSVLVVGARGSLLPVRVAALVAGSRATVSGGGVRTEPGEEVVGVLALP